MGKIAPHPREPQKQVCDCSSQRGDAVMPCQWLSAVWHAADNLVLSPAPPTSSSVLQALMSRCVMPQECRWSSAAMYCWKNHLETVGVRHVQTLSQGTYLRYCCNWRSIMPVHIS